MRAIICVPAKREWKGASISFISWILTGLDGYFEFCTFLDAIDGHDVILSVQRRKSSALS